MLDHDQDVATGDEAAEGLAEEVDVGEVEVGGGLVKEEEAGLLDAGWPRKAADLPAIRGAKNSDDLIDRVTPILARLAT